METEKIQQITRNNRNKNNKMNKWKITHLKIKYKQA